MRLMIVGHLEGYISAAGKIALQRGAKVMHCEDIEEALGALFLLLEGATAFLGEFLEINAFDQPGVERSKVLTREYLLLNNASN